MLNKISVVNRISEVMELNRFIVKKTNQRNSIGNDDSFYILDLNDVRLKHRKWMEEIPRVSPFYAIKCNDDPAIVKCLAELGTGFDCASINELKQILDMGIEPNRIIYSHTIKQASHLQFAVDNGVEMVAFDCPAELDKIKKIHPKAKVVLRIKFDANISIVRMGKKFGCDPVTEAPELIKKCKDLELNLIGISFHVGTGSQDFNIYERALQTVRRLFDLAENFELKLNFVDIGGGFLGNDVNLLGKYAKYINRGIEEYFSDPSVTIISEPGRYFAESAYTLVVQVIMKKISQDGHRHYYINDGISQSFMNFFMFKTNLDYEIVQNRSKESDAQCEYPSTIWGQTCNAIDFIIDNQLICELEVGDHIVFKNMGAYTRSKSSAFNGFKIGEIIELN